MIYQPVCWRCWISRRCSASFNRKSGIEERLPSYMVPTRRSGDELRPGTAEMVRTVLSYLHTRPETIFIERVPVKSPTASDKKKRTRRRFTAAASVSAGFIWCRTCWPARLD